ncbi:MULTISPECIES: inorganic phosphate transporter [Halorussus]|uniref:inorganic phosphate transporter n=1 Tax=Halorussus TaxID=1070314 RepID=UPI00209E6855|nr:inorganic phosphate transporter [Halorussus vallis]USZ76040.1 anion permease [Halorussus vallis]
MISGLLAVGLLTSVFAGINTGGSSIGESFGPSVGSGVLSTRVAAALMSVSVLLGGITLGRHVVDTLGHGFVPQAYFTLPAAIGVLLFTGLGILLGNLREVSVSTSETAVGAVAGMGAAFGVLDWETIGVVVTWWLVSPIVAFWLSAVVGRYWYHRIEDRLDLSGGSRSTAGKALVVVIACYMGFSAGASNVANAIAPLVGAGVLPMAPGVLLGAGAMAVGAFLIGPRTMETVGNELTSLSLEGALVVELIAATIITLLSQAGIPASLAITAVTCVIGLGWGRATRHVELREGIGLDRPPATDGGTAAEPTPDDLFSEETTRHVVVTWMLSPTVAAVLSFVCFKLAVWGGLVSF